MHRLACHHCGHVMPPPKACPECGEEDSLVACGPGVERIADEVAELFPEATTAIVTSDTIWSPARRPSSSRRWRRANRHRHRHPAGDQGLSFPQSDAGRRGRCRSGLAGRRPCAPPSAASSRSSRSRAAPAAATSPAGSWSRPTIRKRRSSRLWWPAMRPASMPPRPQARREAAMPPFGGSRRSSSRPRTRARPRKSPGGSAIRRPGGGMAVFGPAPAPLAMLRGRHRQRLLVHAARALDVQDVIRDWLDGSSGGRRSGSASTSTPIHFCRQPEPRVMYSTSLRPRAACAFGRDRRHSRQGFRRCGLPGGRGSAPRHDCRRWRCRPHEPPSAGRSPRRSAHSCGFRRAGSCEARATPPPGKPCPATSIGSSGAAAGRSIAASAPCDKLGHRAVVLDERRIWEQPRSAPRCRRTSAGKRPSR
jgi:hypothetical protein